MRTLSIYLGRVSITLFMLAGPLTIAKGIMAAEAHKPVWEANVPDLLSAQWSHDDKYVVCSAEHRVVVLGSSNGKTVWSRDASRITRFGTNPKQLLVRSPDQTTVDVLSLETGEPIRQFQCPHDVKIYSQQEDGVIYGTDMSGKRIIRFKEAGEVEALFNVDQTNELFGSLGRGSRARIIFIDDKNVFFTVKGYLGLINRETGKISVPAHGSQLLPHAMLQPDGKKYRFLTATSSNGIVGVDAGGNLTEVESVKVYEPTFMIPEQRLLVDGESTGEHQPAFVNLRWLDANKVIRIPWLSEEIGGVIPDSNLSRFITFNRGGQIGMWSIANLTK
jgi:hypothetical protein